MPCNTFNIICDFNAELLARFLRVSSVGPHLDVSVAPYGQVFQSLTCGSVTPVTYSFVWARAEAVIPTYAKALQLQFIDTDVCLAEVEDFADLVVQHAQSHGHCFVVPWSLTLGHRGYGMLDWRPKTGLKYLLAQMNCRLAERLAEASNVHMLDSERWFQRVADPTMAKMWYAAKVPYANRVFEAATTDIVSAINGLTGNARRLIVLDLDNTLWGDVIGETGWQGVRLGGHDHVGEAYRDFQTALRSLTNRGIQLAISSKNDEAVAMDAIDHHPEMMLRREHFAGWRINWSDKAVNIAALAEELNLGLASVVFIDDNPAERDRVRTALPDVLVPEWPNDPADYASALLSLDSFDTPTVSEEDRSRTEMYVAERERRGQRSTIVNVDDWLATLDTRLKVQHLNEQNLPRVAQLFNKTNQLNMSTRRLSETELSEWVKTPGRSLLTMSVSDRFGDLGLVGVVGIEAHGEEGRITDFILSCRAMGRKIEETMITVAVNELNGLGAQRATALYLPTERNRPTLDVLRSSSLAEAEEHVFRCLVNDVGPIHETVTIEKLTGDD